MIAPDVELDDGKGSWERERERERDWVLFEMGLREEWKKG